MDNFILIEIGYKSCVQYKELQGRWKGQCISSARCNYCNSCPYDPSKPIKAYLI